MKKIYMKPQALVVVLDAQPILSDSENMGGSKGDYSGSGQLSREDAGWEEDY